MKKWLIIFLGIGVSLYSLFLFGWTWVVLNEHKATKLTNPDMRTKIEQRVKSIADWIERNDMENGIDSNDETVKRKNRYLITSFAEREITELVNETMTYDYNGSGTTNPNRIAEIGKGHCGNYSELYASLYNHIRDLYGNKNVEARVVNVNCYFLRAIKVSHHVTVGIYIDGKLDHYVDACIIDLFGVDISRLSRFTNKAPDKSIDIETPLKPLYRKFF